MEKNKLNQLLKDLINENKILKHFIKNVKLHDSYQNYYTFIVLKLFFISWISIDGLDNNKDKMFDILIIKYNKDKCEDIIKRIYAYKKLYIDYENDESITLKDENGHVFKIREKYEDYEILLNSTSWKGIIEIYSLIPKFKELFTDIEFTITLKDLSNSLMLKKNKNSLISNENALLDLKGFYGLEDTYYLLLLFKCFIFQLYQWDKIFDDLVFTYNKEKYDEKLKYFIKFGYLNNEQILKILKAINI